MAIPRRWRCPAAWRARAPPGASAPGSPGGGQTPRGRGWGRVAVGTGGLSPGLGCVCCMPRVYPVPRVQDPGSPIGCTLSPRTSRSSVRVSSLAPATSTTVSADSCQVVAQLCPLGWGQHQRHKALGQLVYMPLCGCGGEGGQAARGAGAGPPFGLDGEPQLQHFGVGAIVEQLEPHEALSMYMCTRFII